MMNGVNQATFYLLPMLGKHPEEYPRFRDCFRGRMTNSETEVDQFGIPMKELSNERVLSVYTRVGGGNRKDYKEEIEELRNSPGYIEDYDDSFDSTFATFIFDIPAKWSRDFDCFMGGRIDEISEEYVAELIRVWPKLEEQFRQIFNKS